MPDNHNYNNNIYISGDFEGWSGGKDQFKLEKNKTNYFITVPKFNESIKFKFTLGSWDAVECDAKGNSIDNRVYDFYKSQDSVNVQINNWSDSKSVANKSTSTYNVHVFSERFKMPQLNRERKIWIYLPPNYENSRKTFSVLYLQDGQNMFDDTTSFAGEWQIDETLNRLSESKGLNLIVVAIENGGDKRLSEYSPWENKKYGMAEGEAYLDFIVHTLKPEIDKVYRTKTAANHTAIMGSSMGGLISHYAGLKYPEVFGKVGVFSPSFWYADEIFNFTKTRAHLKHEKIYYLVGDQEGEDMVQNTESMMEIMKTNGFSENNLFLKVVPKGTHSESLWRTEFEEAISWLFRK
ncbi:alpha/beta hydrolase-fold protein [Gaetbulibacter aquiaggeris]|uniref:Alpha/beta hydrolase-fold protein n=1 Tax=Gaetbulibacter aquiaggeris TaxID=1735373 RepID=A0ABW7MLW8_9FLAO